MFTITCDKCGTPHTMDESRIPPSGMVMKCPACSGAMTVMPSRIGEELSLDEFAPAPSMSGHAATTDLGLGGPQRGPAGRGLATGPALAAFDAAQDDGLDLLAPKGPSVSSDIVDLPAPKAPASDIVDLPAPKAPAGARGAGLLDEPDLLAPVGPSATRSDAPDLLAPVGPTPTRGGMPDLLAPVGPTPTRGGMPDLLAPVGPTPSNLPAPKGFFDDAPPSAATPAPPIAKPPAMPLPAGVARPPAASAPSLDLDDLDLVPASTATPPAGAPGLSLGGPSPDLGLELESAAESAAGPATSAAGLGGGVASSPAPAFALDGLDLLPPEPSSKPAAPLAPAGGDGGGLSFGEVDLAPADDDAGSGVVSFGKPSAAGKAAAAAAAASDGVDAGASGDMLDLAADLPTRKPAGTVAADAEPVARVPIADAAAGAATADAQEARPARSPEAIRRRKMITAAVVVAVLCAGAGFYVKTRMDEAAARKKKIANGLQEAKKLLGSDQPGHWDAAIAAADKVLKVDKKNADALGIAAQAHLAAALDEGRKRDERFKSATKILHDDGVTAQGPEIDRAQALRKIFEEKPAEAAAELAKQQQKSKDPVLALYAGWAALSAGQNEAAKKAFDAALVGNKERKAALFGKGRAEYALGDREGARATFEKLRDLTKGQHLGAAVYLADMLPQDREGTREKRFLEIIATFEKDENADPRELSRAWTLAGVEALGARRLEDATARFAKARDLDDGNVDAIVGQGLAGLAQGKRQEARNLFEHAIQLQSDSVQARLGLTRLALFEGNVGDAQAHIDVAVKKAPRHWEVQYWLGRVLEVAPTGAGLFGAEEAYRRSIAIIEEDKEERYEPYIALSQLLNRDDWNPPRKEEARKVLDPIKSAAENDAYLANVLGAAHLNAGDPVEAQRWFEISLRRDAQNAEVKSNLGAALEAQGNLDAALARHEEAYAIDPANETIALRLARTYARAKRYDKAQALYEALLDESKGRKASVPVKAAAGRYYAARGDHRKAAALGESIYGEDPRHAAGLFLRGLGALQEGRTQDAQKLILEAISIDDDPQYLHGLGYVYEQQKLFEEALTRYGQALDRDARYTAPMLGRARIRMARREWTQALKDLEVAIAIDPERASIWVDIGRCRFEMARKKEAVEAYRKAIQTDPKLAEAYYELGRAYYEMNKPGESIAAFTKALEHRKGDEPWLHEAYRMLGYDYKTIGRHGEMCAAFERYMELAPENAPQRKDIKQILLGCLGR